jgi:hypothetical protein
MKTLYESILDDEEELMSGFRSDINNSFIKIHSVWFNYNKKLQNIPDNELNYLMNSVFEDLELDKLKPDYKREFGVYESDRLQVIARPSYVLKYPVFFFISFEDKYIKIHFYSNDYYKFKEYKTISSILQKKFDFTAEQFPGDKVESFKLYL